MRIRRVLGCDASTKAIGWAIFDYETARLIKHGQITFDVDAVPFYKRLMLGPVKLELEARIRDHQVDAVILEHAFFSKNADTGKKITQVQGAILHRVQAVCGIKRVEELAPSQIKKRYAGHGFATKDEMIRQVRFQYGHGTQNVSDDEADAIAIAEVFITLDKEGYFIKKAQAKIRKKVASVKKRKATAEQKKAEKSKTNLKGELNLF